MVKVSVIITTYNGEKYIERTLRSVLNQTIKDLEVIVVDDCSVDNTVNIVKKFIKKDKRVRLIRLRKNSGGPMLPRNIGVKNARGEYISFLDQDDIYLPDNLEKKIQILKKKKIYGL